MEWNGTEHNFSIPKKSGMEYRKTWNGTLQNMEWNIYKKYFFNENNEILITNR